MMTCCQIALSSMDLTRSHSWYRTVLGFLPAGDRRHLEGPVFAAIPGLPEACFDVWCLVGRREFVQFELFEFARPIMRPRPASWRPCDVGYSMFAVRVPSFDETLRRISEAGAALLTPPLGSPGSRRVCIADPDGILVELIEDAALDAGAVPELTGVTLSVPSIERALEFWVSALGLSPSPTSLHSAAHESLWGLTGSVREAVVLDSGSLAVELVEYESPLGRARPADYRLSDQGILNVALGSTDRAEFDAAYRRAIERGFKGHTRPWTLPGMGTVVYLRDADGLSVELLHVEPDALQRMGFVANESVAENRGAEAFTREVPATRRSGRGLGVL